MPTTLSSDVVRTDGHGRFEFVDVPRDVAELRATRLPSQRSARVALADQGDVAAVRLTLDSVGFAQIAVRCAPGEELFAWIEDSRGESLWMEQLEARQASAARRLKLYEGRSPSLNVPTSATVLCVQRAGVVERSPIEIVAGEFRVLR